MYRYILRESCSQFDSLPLTSLTTLRRIVTSKSSEMNVQFPGENDGDDWIEQAIPEQFFHEILKPAETIAKIQDSADAHQRELARVPDGKPEIYSRISDLYHAC